jgi:hypothetical protein
MKRLIVAVLTVVMGAVAFAQPATPSSSFAWSYPTTGIGLVDHFELQVDGGAWASVGKVTSGHTVPAGDTGYRAPIPALAEGAHTARVRACLAVACGPETDPLAFTMVILVTPRGLIIITPGQ